MWTGLEMERGRSRTPGRDPGSDGRGLPHRGDWSEGSSSPGALRLQSLRPPRGGAVGQGPWDGTGTPGAGMGPAKRRRELGISNHFPGEGRMGSFWFPLQQEGKLRRGPVPSLTF